jgi:hypothetical protein
MMNVHQNVLINTTTLIHNVFLLGTQTMNPSIGYTIILVNYQITRPQLVTPIVRIKNSMLPTSTYPMWYNVIPPFMPLNPSLYLV